MSESLILRIAALEKEVEKLRKNQEHIEMEVGIFDQVPAQLEREYENGTVCREDIEVEDFVEQQNFVEP